MDDAARSNGDWSFNKNWAELCCGELAGQVNVSHPQSGLNRLSIGTGQLSGHILAVRPSSSRAPNPRHVAGIADDFMPLAGDRAFADDPAIIGGLARIEGRRVMLIGHEKGDDTASRLKHNFGMAKPEGYRKAIRLMQLADRFGLPVVIAGRHVRRLPRRPGRGARPGRGDRPVDRAMPGAGRADDRRGGR